MKSLNQIKAEMEYGDVFKTGDFLQEVDSGGITSYDGVGYPYDGEKELDIEIFDLIYSKCERMTKAKFCRKYPYVCWYNK